MGPLCVRWWLIVVIWALVLGCPGSYSLRGFIRLSSKRYSIEQSQRALSINNLGFVDEVRSWKDVEGFSMITCVNLSTENRKGA